MKTCKACNQTDSDGREFQTRFKCRDCHLSQAREKVRAWAATPEGKAKNAAKKQHRRSEDPIAYEKYREGVRAAKAKQKAEYAEYLADVANDVNSGSA